MKHALKASALASIFALALVALAIALPSSAQDTVKPISPTFTTIAVPGAMGTVVLGINTAGEMVGYYYNVGSDGGTGFLYSGGNFTFINYPGADLTEAVGINDSGLISGTAYMAENTAAVGFTYDGANFNQIAVPNQEFTLVNGINNAGAVVGGYGDGTVNKAFEDIAGRFRNVTPPPRGWIEAQGRAINSLGEIVGLTTGSSTTGFSFKNGTFRTLSVPSSYNTQALGLNDKGIVVGFYDACTPGCAFHGFALSGGKYSVLDYPGAMETQAFGVNNAGEAVGTYTFDQKTYYGFVTSTITTADIDQTVPVH
jgi:hypothetical protein